MAAWHKETDVSSTSSDSKGKDVGTLTEEKVAVLSKELLDSLMNQVRNSDDFKDGSKLLGLLIEMKRTYWPATSKSINAEISLDDKLKDWWLANEEFKKMEKERMQNLENEKILIAEVDDDTIL